MKRILFLDIDGVLNSDDWGRRRVRPPSWGSMANWQKEAEDSIDPDAVARLNVVVSATGCSVVLSSSWRKHEPLTRMTRILRYRGFAHRLFAATPHIMRDGDGSELLGVERGTEIDAWLKMHGGSPTFAIVDDDGDMEPHLDRLVQTDTRFGLTEEKAVELIEMLTSGP